MSKISMLERFMAMGGGKVGKVVGEGAEMLGKGVKHGADAMEHAGQWMVDHPKGAVGGAIGLGAGGALAHHALSDDDDMGSRAKHKLHDLLDGIL